MFFPSLFSYVVLACTSSEDYQISYSPEHSQQDSGENMEPSSSAQEPSQEDTGSEYEDEFDWDEIPSSLTFLTEGVHRISWEEHHVYVSVPTMYSGDEPLPMVIILHDGDDCASSNPAQELAMVLLNQFPAVAMYPQSNACTWSQSGTADIDFVQGVIADWASHPQVDETRVSLMGVDQGGQLALNTHVDNLTGLGILLTSSKEGWSIPSSRLQHSFVQLVNKRDSQVPFPGGNGLQSVPDSVLQWVEHNDCSYEPDISTVGSVSVQEYPDCVSNSRVVLASVLPDPWHEECQSSWQQAQQNGTQMVPPEGIECGETHELPSSAFSSSSWKFVWELFSQ